MQNSGTVAGVAERCITGQPQRSPGLHFSIDARSFYRVSEEQTLGCPAFDLWAVLIAANCV